MTRPALVPIAGPVGAALTARLGTAALGLLAVLVLAAPVLALSAFALGAVGSEVAERSARDRLRTVDLAARLVDARLTTAGAQLVSFGNRTTLRAALRSRSAAGLAPHLQELKLSANGHTSAVAFDPRGVMLAADPPGPTGQDFSARDYFLGGMASRDPYTSEAFATAAGGPGPVAVAVSLAVRDGNEVLGLILVGFLPQAVLASLDPLERIDGRETLILDKARRVIAGTDPARAALSTVDLPVAPVPASGAHTTRGRDDAGREQLITYAGIPSAAWTLLVIDDPAVVLAVERRLEDRLAGVALVATLAAIGMGVVLAFLYIKLQRQRNELAAGQATLAAARAEAERASVAKSAFLASMSHELRTPLNAILGFSDLLREQLPDAVSERQKRYLSNIHDAGDHLLGLINDVLDLSKVEAGRVDLRPEVTTLAALTEPVVASTRAAADAGGVRFESDVDGASAVMVDISRVRQILYNLLSNAVKFTPAGGEVRLRLWTDGPGLAIEVADTGIGIPADKRDRVFGTFERLHEGTSHAPGTGLGLALTKGLVELHHGTIAFEDREGGGTAFRVALPDVVADLTPGDRVLVVEDDRRDAELIVALAVRARLATEVVGSVEGALAAIRRTAPIAVVLDIRLPDGRGERVLDALKSEAATRDIPVIVVTVEDDEGVTRGLGADEHLTKPLDRERLDRWLRRVAAGGTRAEVSSAITARHGSGRPPRARRDW